MANRTFPEDRQGLVAKAETLGKAWEAEGASTGIPDDLLRAVRAATAASAEANQRQVDSALAARVDTRAANNRSRSLRRLLGGAKQAVGARAALAADPQRVWLSAGFVPPSGPHKLPPPGSPTSVACDLRSDGSIAVTWTAITEHTVFRVYRRVTDANNRVGPDEELASGCRAPLVDATVPAGSRGVAYTVQANRGGTLSGWSGPGTIQFVADAAPPTPRLAAA